MIITAAKRNMFKVIGRVMEGKSVVGYVLLSDTGARRVYSLEVFAYLVGGKQVVNVKGQYYDGKMIYRGMNGLSLNDLPIVKSNKTAKFRNVDISPVLSVESIV